MIKVISSLFIFFITIGLVQAQEENKIESKYDPHALFAPNFYATGGTISRAATGEPNVGYWQNKADYQINATLNDVTNQITASVIITYKNNSPHALPFLWLQLDQNLFNKESRGQARMPLGTRSRYGDSKSNFNGGYKITTVKLVNENADANYIVTDTRMQIRLSKNLKPAEVCMCCLEKN